MWKLAIASSRLKVVRKSSSLSNVQLFLSLDSTSHNKKQGNTFIYTNLSRISIITFQTQQYKFVCIVLRCWLNPSVAENYWPRPRLCLNHLRIALHAREMQILHANQDQYRKKQSKVPIAPLPVGLNVFEPQKFCLEGELRSSTNDHLWSLTILGLQSFKTFKYQV